MRCTQETRRGEPCEREAVWVRSGNPRFPDDRYCTQHANEYDPGERGRKLGRGWKRVKDSE